jgi:hypothetical protein
MYIIYDVFCITLEAPRRIGKTRFKNQKHGCIIYVQAFSIKYPNVHLHNL